jgi:hypothetical protein
VTGPNAVGGTARRAGEGPGRSPGGRARRLDRQGFSSLKAFSGPDARIAVVALSCAGQGTATCCRPAVCRPIRSLLMTGGKARAVPAPGRRCRPPGCEPVHVFRCFARAGAAVPRVPTGRCGSAASVDQYSVEMRVFVLLPGDRKWRRGRVPDRPFPWAGRFPCVAMPHAPPPGVS